LSAEARNILTSCRFFSQVRGDSLDRLISMARVKRYSRGTVVFRQGEPCPGVFILGTGLVRIFKTAPSGKEHVLHFVEPGHTFAEVAAIGGFPCPAYAEAIQDSTCVLLPTGPFAQALREDHTLCLQIMSSMAFWVRHLVGLMEDIVLRDAAGRVARYLLDACGSEKDLFVLRSLKKDLASHLNLTSETLSRTLRRLVDAGLIEQRAGGRLRIVRREELERLANGVFPLV
jgi:CRP/FNR family transcriptional regulator, dissimilatory nitrate respiration regulator